MYAIHCTLLIGVEIFSFILRSQDVFYEGRKSCFQCDLRLGYPRVGALLITDKKAPLLLICQISLQNQSQVIQCIFWLRQFYGHNKTGK